MSSEKPLGIKAYGSIPHLPGSKRDKSDKKLHKNQSAICTSKTRDWKDTVIVTEKLDGSCVSVAKIDNKLVPLTRSGYRANTSPYKQHHIFSDWVYESDTYDRFWHMLYNGERCVAELMLQVHGSRYDLPHEPFVMFDIFESEHERIPYINMISRANKYDFITPKLVSYGPAVSIEEVMSRLKVSGHGCIDPVEGAVWRVERDNKVDFLGKYVRVGKEDGKYMREDMWNVESF